MVLCRKGGEIHEPLADAAAFGATIEAKPRYGYRLQIMDEDAYRRWSLSDGEAAAIPETMAERVRYLLQFLLRQDGYVYREQASLKQN